MKKEYRVEIRELLSMAVPVFATDEEEACRIVKRQWEKEKIVLTAEHFQKVQFCILEEKA